MERFSLALVRLRDQKDWNQSALALKLGVSVRTLSNWECGYWLPPFKQRIHLVLSLSKMPPEVVLEVADALGVSVDPAVAPFLQPYRDALAPPEEPEVLAPPPPAPPPRAPTDPALLRSALDAVVRESADGMNVAANELRAAIGRALAACAELGATVDEAREAVRVKEKALPTAATKAAMG